MDYKVILLGDTSVGKTCLFNAIIRGEGRSSGPSVGGTFAAKFVAVPGGARLRLNLWDTAGAERFLAVTQNYYRDTDAAIFVYDVTSKASFKRLRFWMGELQSTVPNFLPVIVGNKLDLVNGRDSFATQAQALAKAQGGIYFGVSAESLTNISEMLEELARNLSECKHDRSTPLEPLTADHGQSTCSC